MKNKEMSRENIERLLKGTKTMLLVTDNGIGVNGDLSHILTAYSFLTENLVKGGIPKRYLKLAFDMVDEPKEERKEKKNKIDEKAKKELKEMLKGLSEALTKDLEEMFGDDDE